MSDDVRIREAVLDDYKKLMPLHKEVHDLHAAERPDKYKPAGETLDLSYFEELLSDKQAKIYLAEVNGELAAFTILKKVFPPALPIKVQTPYVFMNDLGVSASFRRRGLARMLFQKAIEFTKECGADSLELGVWEFNQNAINFYEKMGMTTQARKMEVKVK